MKRLSKFLLATALASAPFACQKAKDGDSDKKKDDTAKTDKPGASRPTTIPKKDDIPAPDDVAAAPSDALKTESGIAYKVVKAAPAGGEKPTADDKVEVHYTGWTTDGKMFDSSVKRGKPAVFGLKGVIAGWTEGVQLMTEGETTRFWIPEELAYKGKPGAPAGMLVFDIELISIKKAPAVPVNVAAPPADAKKTDLGVSYKILKSGKGGDKPRAWDQVKVDYTGWTTDGKMFDSSVTRGRPATFPLNGVIAGWTDALQLMSVGDSYRLWIPQEHAYGDDKTEPQGMLVFDVELHEITPLPEPPPTPKDVAEPPKNAKKTDLGVFYTVLKAGKGGDKPKAWDKVKIEHTGWTTDGKLFNSSKTGRNPKAVETALDARGMIPGWTDAIQLMSVGDTYRIWVPEEHAYAGAPRKPKGMLVFDIELLEVTSQPAPPKAPEDVAKPPNSAKKTEKGVFYRVLKKGKGGAKPTAKDKVEVHYSGWTTDGKMFDSSVKRGKTATFPLNGVIAGWTDGLQVMTVGEKTRFWIPEELAYKGSPGKPAGMLVFDVELVSIQSAPAK